MTLPLNHCLFVTVTVDTIDTIDMWQLVTASIYDKPVIRLNFRVDVLEHSQFFAHILKFMLILSALAVMTH
jgi:hypothetical protein